MMLFILTLCILRLIVASVMECDQSTDCKCCVENACRQHPSYSYIKYQCHKGCIDGYRGAQCYARCPENCKACLQSENTYCTDCPDGYFLGTSKDCKGKCPFNCIACDSASNCSKCKEGFFSNGTYNDCRYPSCPANCVCEDEACIKCKNGFYNTSVLCSTTCPKRCASCISKEICTQCKDGHYSGFEFLAESNTCGYNCRHSCKSCTSYDECTICNEGTYGLTCENNCSVGCDSSNCSIATGECDCLEPFIGSDCTNCTKGKYGSFCNMSCPSTCENKLCDKNSGDCLLGCVHSNFTGRKCSACTTGTYGNMCDIACSANCMNSKCAQHNGECIDGCIGNFNGSLCHDCVSSMFGPECNLDCPERCLDGICERNSGHCLNCNKHFAGTECERCIPGFYGSSCKSNCSKHCLNGTCDKVTGTCNGGCKVNFSGERCCLENDHCSICETHNKCRECKTGQFGQLCEKKCSTGCDSSCNISTGFCDLCKTDFFGPICEMKCSKTCNKTVDANPCDQLSGRCIAGCNTGTFGPTCNKSCSEYCVNDQCEQDVGNCLHGCTGGYDASICSTSLGQRSSDSAEVNVTGPIIGSVVGVIILATVVIFVVFIYKRRQGKSASTGRNSELASHKVNKDHTYGNVTDAEERTMVTTLTAVVDIGDVKIDKRATDLAANSENPYNNMEQNKHCVKVDNLLQYVTKEHVDSFANEFMKLNKGLDLTTNCTVARKPENVALNRYNGIYPYDHSRVTSPDQPDFFMNACYIDGYNRRKAYIASLGPTAKTTNTFSTFWLMVWNEKSDIIVMLTNLYEATGMKCERYWPKVETDSLYGEVDVTCLSVEEFAEYTVRTFRISKGKEQRNVLQLHYTAWPDKGVPLEVTSLVEFRQRVKAVPLTLDGPIIVHCSAGVGRTGTYIALDQLTEEGKCEGSVNIFNCVNKMRKQRVNMVQTAEQYIFLHKSLVHSLSFGCEALTAEQIQGTMYEKGDRMFTKLYKTLRQEVDTENKDEADARQENRRKYKDKTRRQSDVPGDRSRVRLYLSRTDGQHDYINAVFINSFRIKNLFIVAQSPLPGTVEDFLSMIYQQSSSCVVALEEPHNQHTDVGKYLPADNETYTFGNYTVVTSKCETKPQYVLKKMSIRNEKGEEKTVAHFQYKNWGNAKKVPDNAETFVQFVKEVENCIRRQTDDSPHIVVHCLNGYERSGLFCVVYKLLEKLEAERQVSVVNTVRKIRTHRKQSITSMEQLKFCYQCISAYMEIYNTYSNFAT